MFGFYITSTTVRAVVDDGGQPVLVGDKIETAIVAGDYTSICTRRYVNETIPAGTLKAALIVVVSYLSADGVTLYVSQPDGPTLPDLAYDYRNLGDVLTELSRLTGWVVEIDYSKVLRMYSPASLSAPFNITDSTKHIPGDISVSLARASGMGNYANRVIVRGGTPDLPVTATADDAGEQASHGLWEAVIAAPTATDTTIAQALADAYLLQHLATPKVVTYPTFLSGLYVGRVQTITLTKRNLNNTFLITGVATRNEPKHRRVRRTVTAIEGTVFKQSWRDLYRMWTGGASTTFAGASGTSANRPAFYFGASEDIWVQDAGPTWVPCGSGVQVSIDPAGRGTTSAQFTVRLRARSGDVTARLRNLTTNATVGTSAAISATANLTTVTFGITLTAGLNVYELQLLPTVANEDVQGVGGYLE
jgi:hypothetical protein